MLCYELFHILGLLCLGQARNWPIVTFKWQSKGKIKVIVIVKQMRLVSKKDVQNERHGIKWLKLFKKYMSWNTNYCRPFFVKNIRNKTPLSHIPHTYINGVVTTNSITKAFRYVCYLYLFVFFFSSLSLIALRNLRWWVCTYNYGVIFWRETIYGIRTHVRGQISRP